MVIISERLNVFAMNYTQLPHSVCWQILRCFESVQMYITNVFNYKLYWVTRERAYDLNDQNSLNF